MYLNQQTNSNFPLPNFGLGANNALTSLNQFGSGLQIPSVQLPNIVLPNNQLPIANQNQDAINAQMFTPYVDPYALKESVTNMFSFDSFEFSKKLSLIVLAGLLVGFGLYMLARKTETYKLAVETAKTVATKGAA